MKLLVLMLALVSVQSAEPQDINVTGKWLFQVETGAGSGTPTVEFKQDGEKLTGRYTGQLGDVDFTGTLKGKTITFTFSSSVSGFDIKATYTGTVETKDSMKGTLVIEGLGEGTFTGKRQ